VPRAMSRRFYRFRKVVQEPCYLKEIAGQRPGARKTGPVLDRSIAGSTAAAVIRAGNLKAVKLRPVLHNTHGSTGRPPLFNLHCQQGPDPGELPARHGTGRS